MVLLQFGKESSVDTLGEMMMVPTSSSPEMSSGNSSLSNGHSSLSDVINEWKQELEVKKCELRHKNAAISDLQERLQEKDAKICDAQSDLKSIQLERDKYCQMVSVVSLRMMYESLVILHIPILFLTPHCSLCKFHRSQHVIPLLSLSLSLEKHNRLLNSKVQYNITTIRFNI
jgi:hypothetical protein